MDTCVIMYKHKSYCRKINQESFGAQNHTQHTCQSWYFSYIYYNVSYASGMMQMSKTFAQDKPCYDLLEEVDGKI